MEQISYKTQVFEGPMDLLLHLISKHKLNINDIPIFELVEQYLDYVKKMQEDNLDIASEFLEMAARLVYIKTVSLLPRYEEAQTLKKVLSGELIEYRDCQRAAKELSEMTDGFNTTVKEPEKIKADMTYRRFHDVLELMNAYINAAGRHLRKLPPPMDSFKVIVQKAVVSVSDKISSIYSVLSKTGKIKVKSIFETSKSRSDLVAAFLALLEMAKNGKIYLTGDGDETQASLNFDYTEKTDNG